MQIIFWRISQVIAIWALSHPITNQDLLLPLKSRRQSTDGMEEAAADAADADATDGDKTSEPTSKAAGKNVAFDLGSLDADDVEGGPVGGRPTAGEAEDRDAPIAASTARATAGGNLVKSAPPAADPASREKLYRRHIARFYARSASRFEEINDSMFPDLPGLPAAAASPFLDDVRNKQVWQWLNGDFCKTKLDYFLSLCS